MAKFTLILISLWLSTLYASSLIATFELWPTLSNVPFNYTHASKTEPQTMGGRFQHGSFAYKDKLFVFGGLATSNDTTSIADGTIWSYHPLTKTWKLEFDPENETQSSTPYPIYVMLNGNYDVYGNTLYVWGGVLNVNGTNQPNNTIWSLDIDEMKWSLLGGGSDIDVYSNDGTGMPPSYSGNCISYHNGKLYSYGGSTTPPTGLPVKTRTADFWIFNLTDNKFYLIKGNGSFIPTVYDSTIGSTDSLDCFIRQEKFYVVSNDVWTIDLATYSESLYMQLVPNGNYNESNGDLSPPATYYRIGYTLKDYYVIYGGQPGRQEDTIWGLDLNNKKWYLLFGSDIDGFYSTTGSVFSDGIGIIGSVANTDIIFSEFYNKSFVIAGNKYYDEYSQVPSNDVWSFSCDSESGTFGPLCLNCTCAHGICNDGIYGDGTCSSCYDGYEGENCNIQVAKDETITHATSVDTTLATNEETTGQTSYIQSTVESTQGTVILDVSISTSYSEGDQSTTDSNDETSNQNNNETYVADNISSANVGVLTPGSVAGIVITVVIVGVIIILIVFFVTKRKKIQPTKRYDNNAKLGGNTPHISLSESGSDIISSLESSFYVSDSSGICSGDDMS